MVLILRGAILFRMGMEYYRRGGASVPGEKSPGGGGKSGGGAEMFRHKGAYCVALQKIVALLLLFHSDWYYLKQYVTPLRMSH